MEGVAPRPGAPTRPPAPTLSGSLPTRLDALGESGQRLLLSDVAEPLGLRTVLSGAPPPCVPNVTRCGTEATGKPATVTAVQAEHSKGVGAGPRDVGGRWLPFEQGEDSEVRWQLGVEMGGPEQHDRICVMAESPMPMPGLPFLLP